MQNVSLIFLSGGCGNRMNTEIPKQYLSLGQKPLFAHSLEMLLSLPCILEVIIVANKEYHDLFTPFISHQPFSFALPGLRRQDSVYEGLKKVSPSSDLICIHDAARPFPPKQKVLEGLYAAKKFGASVLGHPSTDTLKLINRSGFIEKGIPRSLTWAMQTPQIIKKDFLDQGFQYINKKNIEVTDDVAIMEHLNIPVKVIESPASNFKITHPEDLERAHAFLQKEDLCVTS